MNREALNPGTILRFPDGQEHEIVGLLGAGGNALMYETRILGSELYAAVKEVFPALGYLRIEGQIRPVGRSSRRAKELARRKAALEELETRLSQKASRKNHQVLYLQPPVWHQADIRLPDGTVLSNVENTYARMDSLAEKGTPLPRFIQERPSSGKDRLTQTLQIMDTVLDAYSGLHEDGFLHGDCQVSNLFLLQSGRGNQSVGTACILDFGSARELGSDGYTAPVTDEIFSTDGYCAPELLFPPETPLRLTAAADVWSLGFLFLNLLTDRDLTGMDGITEFLLLHPEEKRLTETEIAELGCSPAQAHLINSILDQTLSNRPDDRYSTAGALRADIRKLICCHTMDISRGIDRYLLWEASWRYSQSNPTLFRTEHEAVLCNDLPVRRLQVKAKAKGSQSALPASWLVQDASRLGENVYLYGSGGSGKSFSAALRLRHYLTHGEERVPLYLDLAAYTSEKLEQCHGDPHQVIPTLLAEQYFFTPDCARQIGTLLREEHCCLVLDNLHKVGQSVQSAAFDAVNRLSGSSPNTWLLVLGRSAAPGARAEDSPFRRTLIDDFISLSGMPGEAPVRQEEPAGTLNMTYLELQPLEQEIVVEKVKTVWPGALDFRAGTGLLKQMETLSQPMFLMRYLELLAVSDGTLNALPDSAMALLHGYFARREYEANDRTVHTALTEQLPWIALQFEGRGQLGYSAARITELLLERGCWDTDPDAFLPCAADNLAVLESNGRGRYRFTHDCYQEYFLARFGADCIRRTISTRSTAPLKDIQESWNEEQVSRCLDLCCLTVRNGAVVRIREKEDVLEELGQILNALRKRDLTHANDAVLTLFQYLQLAIYRGEIHNTQLFRVWKSLALKSSSGFVAAIGVLGGGLLALAGLIAPKKDLALRSMSIVSDDGAAEYALACLYHNGEGGHSKNPEKAEKYLQKAEAKGYPLAWNTRGELEEAAGHTQAAMELYLKAAEKQVPRAMWNLGRLYLDSSGTNFDPQKAVDWFRKGADGGDPLAQYSYAQILERGIAGSREEARIWYQRAADQGIERAAEALQRLDGRK